MRQNRVAWIAVLGAAILVIGSTIFFTRTGLAQLAATELPNAWHITGTDGAVKDLDTLPQGLALSPDGFRIALVEAGVAPTTLHVFDARTLDNIATIPVNAAFGQPAWDADGAGIWVATGDDNTIVHVNLQVPDRAAVDKTVQIAPPKSSFYPSYIARDPQSGLLAVSGESSGAIAIVDPVNQWVERTIAIDTQNANLASHPAQLVWAAKGTRIFVALWGKEGIAVLDPARGRVIRHIHTALHPEALALSAGGTTLYVANTDDDSISAIDVATEKVRETLRLRLFAAKQYGLQPNDIFIDDAGHRLYVTLADANAVAIIDTSTPPMKFLGAVPTGWYPTGSVALNGLLVVVDGKGESSHANPAYDPYAKRPPAGKYDHVIGTTRPKGYIGYNLTGALRQMRIPADTDLAAETAQVQRNAGPMLASAARPQPTISADEADGEKVVRPNGPIHHVIYIIKENRTYDQVLGDEARGDGDPNLAVFGKAVTPNLHAIAERFGLFDRVFTDSHVSEDGHQWLTQAFANDYLEKSWPAEYADRRQEGDANPYITKAGFIWDAAKTAHLTYRTYGEFATADPHHKGQYIGDIPSLVGHTAPYFPPFDLAISDQTRLARWEKEFWMYAAHGDLPQLETVWLVNDHTMGTRAGARTPQAFVADNDLAVGHLVEDVSHSRYWKDTAIFIIEDDAQNGPDHVDDQRTTMYVVSPYARGGLQHHHYTQAGLLHTIEIILGLPQLSTYDAAADPLYAAFTSKPNFAPFQALHNTYPLDMKNAATAYGAAVSAKLDFSRPDAIDPRILNALIMHAANPGKVTQ